MGAEAQDGEEFNLVVKVSAGAECSVEKLANELLGSMLAADLDLPVNEPFLVELSQDFIDAVTHEATRARLAQSNPLAFGCQQAGRQWHNWLASDLIPHDMMQTALGILAFDGFIGNSDRSPRNSNLLVKGERWRMIDHEAAFGFRMMLFPPCEPWTLGNLDLLRNNGNGHCHIFSDQLSRCAELHYEEIEERWAGLTDARIAQYDATLPQEWDEAREYFEQALEHIRNVRGRIGDCITELRRVLQ